MLSSPRESLEKASQRKEFVDVSHWPGIHVDLRYASENNLLGKNVYGGFQRALLHEVAAKKLAKTCEYLQKFHPKVKIIIFDALRPEAAQHEFWNLVRNTPKQPYFANPAKGSVHSYGFALDVSLLSPDGVELDMGTAFDDLSPLSEPRLEEQYLREGKLTSVQRENRELLRRIMGAGEFLQLPVEWWHYDAIPGDEVRAKYARVP